MFTEGNQGNIQRTQFNETRSSEDDNFGENYNITMFFFLLNPVKYLLSICKFCSKEQILLGSEICGSVFKKNIQAN